MLPSRHSKKWFLRSHVSFFSFKVQETEEEEAMDASLSGPVYRGSCLVVRLNGISQLCFCCLDWTLSSEFTISEIRAMISHREKRQIESNFPRKKMRDIISRAKTARQ